MDKFFKLSQSKKFVATLVLAVLAFVFAITGITLLNVNAESLSSAVVNEDGTLADITPPTNGGYYGIAHYEFDDKTNYGKDSLGNFDLTADNKIDHNKSELLLELVCDDFKKLISIKPDFFKKHQQENGFEYACYKICMCIMIGNIDIYKKILSTL